MKKKRFNKEKTSDLMCCLGRLLSRYERSPEDISDLEVEIVDLIKEGADPTILKLLAALGNKV